MSGDDSMALLDDLDAAFGAIIQEAEAETAGIQPTRGNEPPPDVRDLFAALAANYLHQVRDLLIGLRWNEPLKDWISICQPALGSLLAAARELHHPGLCAALDGLAEALNGAAREGEAQLSAAARDNVIAAYQALVQHLPDGFSLDEESSRRETVIVHSLLQQVPDMNRLTMDRLYAAGLARLDLLRAATPEEIAQTTGMPERLARQIVDKFLQYRQDIEAQSSDANRSSDKQKLASLAATLRRTDDQFEAVANGWSERDLAEKRRLRQERADLLLQTKVLLARLGELDCVHEIDKLPFKAKIASLERYVRDASAQTPALP